MEFNFDALETTDFSVGKPSVEKERHNWIGGAKQSWPLEVRVVVNMSTPEDSKPFMDASFHEFIDGDSYYRIPCLRSVGEVCPVCDAHWDHKKQQDLLTAQGAVMESHPLHVEWKKHMFLSKKFEQRKNFLMLAVVRGDDKVSILSAKTQLTKRIFGDKYKNLPGAIDELKAYGVPVFNPNEGTGWLILTKTGQGLSTTYNAKPAMITKITGKSKTEQIVEEALSPKVIELFKDMSKLPSLSKIIRERLWTSEEMENYVASGGVQVPKSVSDFLNKNKKDGAEAKPAAAASSEVVSFSDDAFIPF